MRSFADRETVHHSLPRSRGSVSRCRPCGPWRSSGWDATQRSSSTIGLIPLSVGPVDALRSCGCWRWVVYLRDRRSGARRSGGSHRSSSSPALSRFVARSWCGSWEPAGVNELLDLQARRARARSCTEALSIGPSTSASQSGGVVRLLTCEALRRGGVVHRRGRPSADDALEHSSTPPAAAGAVFRNRVARTRPVDRPAKPGPGRSSSACHGELERRPRGLWLPVALGGSVVKKSFAAAAYRCRHEAGSGTVRSGAPMKRITVGLLGALVILAATVTLLLARPKAVASPSSSVAEQPDVELPTSRSDPIAGEYPDPASLPSIRPRRRSRVRARAARKHAAVARHAARLLGREENAATPARQAVERRRSRSSARENRRARSPQPAARDGLPHRREQAPGGGP